MTIVIVNILIIVSVAVLIVRKQADDWRIFSVAFGVKILCGILVGWMYMHYYGCGDTLIFFQDAKVFFSPGEG